jgi:hypothetical protein
MQEPSQPAPREPSRRRPLRRRSEEPVPIPDAAARSRAARTVKVQEVLAAHQRALEQRLEEGLRRIEETLASGPPMPDGADVAKGVLAYADERFQAMSVRLQRIEDALRRLAGALRNGTDQQASGDASDGLAAVVTELGRQQRAFLEALASAQRAAFEDLGRRTGEGVVAVADVLRQEIDGLRTSIRSLHRTMAWDGLSRERPRPGPG